MGVFAEKLFEKLKCDEEFSDCIIKREYDHQKIPFPLKNNMIIIGNETADEMSFLLGYDDVRVTGEKTVVTVMSDEKKGGIFCEQFAEKVCRKIFAADTEKMIISFSTEKCMYDKNAFAYKITMKFGLTAFLRRD